MTAEPTETAARAVPDLQAADKKQDEVLRDLARIVTRHLVACDLDAARAEAIAESTAEEVREHFGGQIVYIAKGTSLKTHQRWERMWADFTGHNHADLARKYGMGVHGVYRVLAIMRAEHRRRAQPDLFLEAGANDK